MEPIAGNMGLVLPREGFLEGLRAVTERYGALLVFDEVMTVPRPPRRRAGAVRRHARPDDARQGGSAASARRAYGGRREVMELVAPAGPVYQAGTLSGNPLAMTAGIETRELAPPGVWDRVEAAATRLVEGIEGAGGPCGARRNDVRPSSPALR